MVRKPGTRDRVLWLYRVLLARAPREFVDEYGQEMEDAFRARLAETGRGLPLLRTMVREYVTLYRVGRQLGKDLGPSTGRMSSKRRVGMGMLAQDVRFALRTLRRNPGFAGLSMLTLALGIGATTGIFTVVNGVLLRPLPYPEPEQLVRVYPSDESRGIERAALSVPDFEDWRRGATRASSMALYSVWPAVLTGGDQPLEIPTAYVTGEFFGLLGQVPAEGRFLLPEEEHGDNFVVVLSYGLWDRQFGRDPSVVGSTVDLDSQPFRVVGVAPPELTLPSENVAAWTFISTIDPTSIPTTLRHVRFAQGIARLDGSATPEQLQSELSSIARELADTHPETNGGFTRALVDPLQSSIVGDVKASLWMLLGAVGFLLIIACVNVASLLLARASGRESEIAIRSAMGAPRRRVLSQLLTEGALLGAGGALLGTATAHWGVGFLLERGAAFIPRSADIALDLPVLLFTMGTTLITVALFALVPALSAVKVDLSATLRESGRDGSPTGLARRMPRLLITTEIALAITLLVGTGLLVRSLRNLQSLDPGFDPSGALAVTLSFNTNKHPDFLPLQRQYLERLRQLPGVTAVGSIRTLPLAGEGEILPFVVPGIHEPEPGQEPFAIMQNVSPGLFEALGIPVLAGRVIEDYDVRSSSLALVISESLAREYFGDGPAVGRMVRPGGPQGREIPVVGVVGDVLQTGLRSSPRATMYFSQEQVARSGMSVVIRSDLADPMTLASTVRTTLAELDPEQPISRIETLEQAVARSVSQPRFFTLVLALFSGLALTLSAIGVYGVISYHVTQRTSELGLRMALGASRGTVIRQGLALGLGPAALGIGIGLGAAAGLSRGLGAMLFGVTTVDPLTYGAVALVLGFVSFLACWIPARRASRIDPARVMA